MKKSGREITRLSITVTLFSLAALLFYSSTSFASASQFLPRFYRFGGELDIEINHDRNVNETETGGSRTSQTTVQERLRLYAAGYIYHPRFISFQGFIGGRLQQDKFERNSGTPSPWTLSTSDEYGLRAKILPQHPYSLELYTERRTPLVKESLSSDYRPVYYDRGVIFRYKKSLSSLTLSSIENISEYGTSTADTVTRAADGSYPIGPFSNSAGHRVTESVISPSQARTTQIFSYFDNNLHFQDASFVSHIDLQRLTQENPLSASLFADDNLAWKEEARISLPWNFQTSAEYGLTEETITQKWSTPASETTLSRETETANYVISHQLYNSLSTNYHINNISSRSTGGVMKTQSQALAGNYVKKIAWGRFITGIFAQRSITDINNSPTILDEIHTIMVPDFFYLIAQNADASAVRVWVYEKITNLRHDLDGTNYTVEQTGSDVRITINNLPFPVSGPPALYDFHVSYSYIQQMVKYETTNLGYTVKFELFNNLINPYFGYSKQDQEVISGWLPGGPQHTATETVGVLVSNPPYSFTEEYMSTVSDINSSRTFRSMVNYRKNIATDTHLNAKTYYTTTRRHEMSAFSDNTFGADAQLQKLVPRNNLSLALGFSYIHRDASITSETYSLNSSLMWRIGKLTLNFSASMSESASTSTAGKNIIVYEQYYLSVSRRIF